MQTIAWSLDLQTIARNARGQNGFESANKHVTLTAQEKKGLYQALHKHSSKEDEKDALDLWM
ncbi:hypothetical protein [Paenibacillus mesophilus]|uniref:hypothetical protein n=1 Tax=Paenibacillus mesophilus TaxID=2582849 RepID=UPI0013054765|nr:hypothetical protein [Paenibacillus mesophilus]